MEKSGLGFMNYIPLYSTLVPPHLKTILGSLSRGNKLEIHNLNKASKNPESAFLLYK